MVGLDLLAANPVDRGRHRVADLEVATLDLRPQHLIVPGRHGVDDLELAAVRGDPTHVSHLPAARRVERVLLQHDVELPLGVGYRFEGDDPRLDLLPLVADEAAPDLLVPERRDHPIIALHGLPSPLPLRPHRSLEPRLIQRDPSLRQHLPRYLDREAVGVVQQERDLAWELPPARRPISASSNSIPEW